MLHEDRLDSAVAAGKVGLGEVVHVTTKMGDHIVSGRVKAGSAVGLLVVSTDGEREVESFFSEQFYRFVPQVREDQPVLLREQPRKRPISDMSPDERVQRKLQRLEQDEEPGAEDPAVDPAAAEEPGSPAPEVPPEDTVDTQVDVNKLPDDIKQAIVTTKEMDPEGVNTFLTLVGDSAVKGLSRAGVAQTELLGVAQAVQNAAYNVLVRRGLARDTLKDEPKRKRK